MQDAYKSIKRASEGFFKDKGSKFYAFAFPVKNKDEIKDILSKINREHHSARHHCYAWRLGADGKTHRANDDGEPTYTAGKPILGQLHSYGVTNVLLVVVRYFGGTLLGKPGLINAYRSAAADALSKAEIITKIVDATFRLEFTYDQIGDVMRLIDQENLNILNTDFKLICNLDFSVRKSAASQIKKLFNSIPGIKITLIPSP